MNRLPDIIVLDFCIWLSKKVQYIHPNNSTYVLDALSIDRLSSYAEDFLHERRQECHHGDYPLRSIVEGFLASEEFRLLESDRYLFERKWNYFRHHLPSSIPERYRMHRASQQRADYTRISLEEIFHFYLLRYFDQYYYERDACYDNIGPNHLADYTLYYLKDHLNSSDNMPTIPPVMNLMIRAQSEVADEINFLEWVLKRDGSKLSFENMPPEVFDELLDEYIKDTGKSLKEHAKLSEAYYDTGWSTIIKRIQRLFSLDQKHPERSFSDVIGRYLSKKAKYNCIILPLADKESSDQFRILVTKEWKNLNELSGDALDIFYSETDIGKTGYDIAMRLKSFPDRLKKTAPSIILWKDSIEEAKVIPTGRLKAEQIYKVIETIVHQIGAENDINTIAQEAEKTVKKQEALNHGSAFIEFSGGKNVVVSGNTGNTFVNQGDEAEFGDITMESTVNNDYEEFRQEIEEAISAIRNSDELEEDSKEQLVSIMEDAKTAEAENSNEKRLAAKKAFGYVKGFLKKAAPTLIATLANLTKIATFFGISLVKV